MSDRWNTPSEESKSSDSIAYRIAAGVTPVVTNNPIPNPRPNSRPQVENDAEMERLLPRRLLDDRNGPVHFPAAGGGGGRVPAAAGGGGGIARQLFPEQDAAAARGWGRIAHNTGLPIQRLMSIHELRQRFTEVPIPINAETRLPDINGLIAGRRYIISNQESSTQYHIIYREPGRINGPRQYVVCTVEWTSLPGNPWGWNDYIFIENGNLVFELPQDQNGGKLNKSRKNKKNRKNKKSRKSRKGINNRKSRKSKK